ncbi:hypothetical protein EON67_12360 [archaeon]|nr:MAG: hypothetical protein EON67_12360 [archaeon]
MPVCARACGRVVQASPTGTAVVIDTGSETLKIGYAREDAPRCVIPTVVGKPKTSVTAVRSAARATPSHAVLMGTACLSPPHMRARSLGLQVRVQEGGASGKRLGADALSRSAVLALTHPVQGGHIKQWEDAEDLWRFAFEQDAMHTEPSEHAVMLVDAPDATKATRERMAQLFFDTFDAPALHIISQPVPAIYASGRLTGLVVESGHGVSYAAAVYEGFRVSTAHAPRTCGQAVSVTRKQRCKGVGHGLAAGARRVCGGHTKAFVHGCRV